MTDPAFRWRLGKWQDVYKKQIRARVPICQALIADLPYGKRTHEGYRSGADPRDRDGIDDYCFITPDEVREFVLAWDLLVDGWIAVMTSHDLIPAWERAFEEVGRLGFAPIPCLQERVPHAAPCAVLPTVISGSGVRLQGDGPGNWTVFLIVARPRKLEFSRWCREYRTPEPYYLFPASRESKKGRGKPEPLMKAIVRDYSRPGDLVIDTHGGWGMTGVAALATGRRFEGCEIDPEVWEVGQAKLSGAHVASVDLFSVAKQAGLFQEGER